ncbi:hypothetical protein LCGC14_1699560 [marine sediment metagenome]|uniref:Uncharacterized protein n=1 Tax=marine sediment metagenome TaxID=412755 RepID=A0A0F9HI55_9ZZZZ
MDLPFAEDIGHYWMTGSSPPDTWIDRAKKLIKEVKGVILAEGYGSMGDQAAYMLSFKINDDRYKVVFPVLRSRTGRQGAAKRQAATMLHHDIKAKCMVASVVGVRAAFFAYLMLPDGRMASELAAPELSQAFPSLLKQQF